MNGSVTLGYSEFKSKFINDLFRFENVRGKIPALKRALDEAVINELPKRDKQLSFQIRDYTNTDSLRISHNSQYLMCKYSNEENCLLVGTLAPSWASGWRNISKDVFVSEQIDSFFHFANQYVYRSYQINLIGAIALTYGRHCDFRGYSLKKLQLPYGILEYNSFVENIPTARTKRNHRLESYLEIINAFDPYVNKAMYYYIRTLSLPEYGYDEEAIINADNAIDTIFQAIKKDRNIPTKSREKMYSTVHEEMNLPKGVISQLDNLYKLRCSFSAHPAHSNWWDFSEIYEEEIEKIMDAVKTTIIKFLMYEANNRKIEKTPSSWSEWFLKNSETIYDAVWFNKLPQLNR